MSILQHKELGNIQYNLVKEARMQTQDRWNKLGFLEGLEGNNSDNIAQLFENQAKHLIKEATNTKITVGQNGVVWISGESADEFKAYKAIMKIEKEAHIPGLTERIKKFLEQK